MDQEQETSETPHEAEPNNKDRTTSAPAESKNVAQEVPDIYSADSWLSSIRAKFAFGDRTRQSGPAPVPPPPKATTKSKFRDKFTFRDRALQNGTARATRKPKRLILAKSSATNPPTTKHPVDSLAIDNPPYPGSDCADDSAAQQGGLSTKKAATNLQIPASESHENIADTSRATPKQAEIQPAREITQAPPNSTSTEVQSNTIVAATQPENVKADKGKQYEGQLTQAESAGARKGKQPESHSTPECQVEPKFQPISGPAYSVDTNERWAQIRASRLFGKSQWMATGMPFEGETQNAWENGWRTTLGDKAKNLSLDQNDIFVFDLKMIGSGPDICNMRPTVLIICNEHIRPAIKRSLEPLANQILPKGIGFEVIGRHIGLAGPSQLQPPSQRRLGLDAYDRAVLVNKIHGNYQQTLMGWIANIETTKGVFDGRSTIGGTLEIGNSLYLLTTAHSMYSGATKAAVAEPTPVSAYPGDFQLAKHRWTRGPEPDPSPIDVDNTQSFSAGDWAVLTVLDTSGPTIEPNCFSPNSQDLSHIIYVEGHVLNRELLKVGHVWVCGGITGVQSGILSSTTATVVVGKDSFITWAIALEKPLAEGDSGSWVVSQDTNRLCGYVFAKIDGFELAYMLPIEPALKDIARAFGQAVSVPDAKTVASMRRKHPEVDTLEESPTIIKTTPGGVVERILPHSVLPRKKTTPPNYTYPNVSPAKIVTPVNITSASDDPEVTTPPVTRLVSNDVPTSLPVLSHVTSARSADAGVQGLPDVNPVQAPAISPASLPDGLEAQTTIAARSRIPRFVAATEGWLKHLVVFRVPERREAVGSRWVQAERVSMSVSDLPSHRQDLPAESRRINSSRFYHIEARGFDVPLLARYQRTNFVMYNLYRLEKTFAGRFPALYHSIRKGSLQALREKYPRSFEIMKIVPLIVGLGLLAGYGYLIYFIVKRDIPLYAKILGSVAPYLVALSYLCGSAYLRERRNLMDRQERDFEMRNQDYPHRPSEMVLDSGRY